jgi:uncharacterized protein
MRSYLAASFFLLWPGGCNRTEEPPSIPFSSSRPSTAAHPQNPGEAPPEPQSEPSCLIPTASEPSPTATAADECPEDPLTTAPLLPRGDVTFVDAPGTPRVEVEIARTERHRARGLMYRTSLPEQAGMLFSWPDERVRSFWMRNTCIPLDMLFITQDGTIVGILEHVPTMNEASRSIPCPAAHVLEVNAGWTRERGIKAGQRVDIATH